MYYLTELERIQLRISELRGEISSREQVQWADTPLTGPAKGCHLIGMDETDGSLYYRDSDGNWQPVPLGVTNINSETGAITFEAGDNIVITNPSEGVFLISSTASPSTPSLQAVTDVGSVTTNTITAPFLHANNGVLVGSSASINSSGQYFGLRMDLGAVGTDGALNLKNSFNTVGTIKSSLLSINRSYQLPDEDGTIALQSDITTPTLSTVLGNSADATGQAAYNFDYINLVNGTELNQNNLVIYNTGTHPGTIDPTNLTAGHTFNLPNQDGTPIMRINGNTPNIAGNITLSIQAPISLTTTGSSGAATFSGNVLNIPNYAGGSTTPGGSDTQIQYNNAGAFGATSFLTYQTTGVTTPRVNVGVAVNDPSLLVQSTLLVTNDVNYAVLGVQASAPSGFAGTFYGNDNHSAFLGLGGSGFSGVFGGTSVSYSNSLWLYNAGQAIGVQSNNVVIGTLASSDYNLQILPNGMYFGPGNHISSSTSITAGAYLTIEDPSSGSGSWSFGVYPAGEMDFHNNSLGNRALLIYPDCLNNAILSNSTGTTLAGQVFSPLGHIGNSTPYDVGGYTLAVTSTAQTELELSSTDATREAGIYMRVGSSTASIFKYGLSVAGNIQGAVPYAAALVFTNNQDTVLQNGNTYNTYLVSGGPGTDIGLQKSTTGVYIGPQSTFPYTIPSAFQFGVNGKAFIGTGVTTDPNPYGSSLLVSDNSVSSGGEPTISIATNVSNDRAQLFISTDGNDGGFSNAVLRRFGRSYGGTSGSSSVPYSNAFIIDNQNNGFGGDPSKIYLNAHDILIGHNTSASNIGLGITESGVVVDQIGSIYGETPDSGVIFQVRSTIAASIPYPLMTNAEMNAIVSPSVGSMVYVTDLGIEGLYINKSSGWTFVA